MTSPPPPPRFEVDQVDHVEFFVPDRHQAAAWYADVLGLEARSEHAAWAANPRGPLMITTRHGGTMLALFSGEPRGERPTAGFHRVAFRTGAEGFLRFLDRLEALELRDDHGERVTADAASDHGTAWSIYFCDPYGHRLELTSYEYEAIRTGLATRRS